MDKRYNHSEFEGQVYKLWEESGGFAPREDEGAEPYTIIMPPPNANDPLHVGHAMFVSIEDVLIRYQRMRGRAALWLPGTDHAGIETQYVFEKKLSKKGKSRFDFDRETLYKMIWDYVEENSGIAIEQMKKLGASADWERYKFMLDSDVVERVLETFRELNKDGLVYRDLALVNYCTKCGTAFSELEVDHVERTDPLYYMKYGPFTLATVRPETKFGDTAVAVNPKDKRYKKYVGKEVEVEGLLGKFMMRVIADDYVDPEFGTGVVKVTPAHDPNDYEIWLRHKEEAPGPKQVIGFDGKMNELAGKYSGMKAEMARKVVAEDLEKEGLMVRVDNNYKHTVGACYRCGRVLEPLPLPQFFIKVKPMVEKSLRALRKGDVKVYGSGHDKVLKHWLENLHDWNVSRQIVWGIRLPIWYEIGRKNEQERMSKKQRSKIKDQNDKVNIKFIDKHGELQSGEIAELLKKYELKEIRRGLQELRAPVGAEYVVSIKSPGEDYIQETDTFDTWFSSSQWPYVALQTRKNEEERMKNGDFERFYPTDVMETGYDILPFWVMRMLMMGLYKTDKVPFESVYLHGLIRDEKGQKMSKSKGNVINPLSVVEEFGADALRMALVIRSTAGQDKNVGQQDIRAMRNLTNKIWNSARFVVLRMTNDQAPSSKQETSTNQEPNVKKQKMRRVMNLETKREELMSEDAYFSKRLEQVVEDVTKQIDDFRPGMAAETVYNEFWHWYCDECIEMAKREELSSKSLLEGLVTFLKLLHPFVPFVTEAVYQELRGNKELVDKSGGLLEAKELMNSSWPEVND